MMIGGEKKKTSVFALIICARSVGKRTEEKLKEGKKKEILKEAAKIKTTIFSSKSLNA